MFNFIDDKIPRKYSSKKELKSLAMRFADKNHLECADSERFLIEVDRLKSCGNLSDSDILVSAFQKIVKNTIQYDHLRK